MSNVYEYYNDLLCISGSALIISKDNPKGIISKGGYDSWVNRKKVKVARRGCNETPALVVFDSLRKKYQKLAKERFGEPKEVAQMVGLRKKIEISAEAVNYFRDYRVVYADGEERHLPEETQELYVNNAAVLDALAKAWNRHVVAIRGRNRRPLSGEFWKNYTAATKRLLTLKDFAIKHDLPKNPRRLQERVMLYVEEGYESIVSGKFANVNTQKITEEIGKWLIAAWSARVPEIFTLEQLHAEYNLKAMDTDWKFLKTSQSIRDYLYRPEIEEQWYAARHGELKYKEKYGRQHRRKPLTKRDTIWYSDGTKLNYYYRDEHGAMKTCNVYEVIDAYSECFLGYHISKSEDYEAQYFAYKMALQTAGHKPYELKYDNQGGHKKLESSDLLKNLARHAVSTAPYNGKSKTIELAFKRFQENYLHKDWFFTGQNITATKLESKANLEFILANPKGLPTLDGIKEAYAKRREEWNNAPHPKTGIPRNEMYRTSVNDETMAVDWLDIITIFGITTKEPATYRASGLQIEVKRQKYVYEVLTADGMPDMNFYRKNIGRRLHTRYCPDDMSIVSLYEKDATGSMRFVTMAQSFIHIEGALQNQSGADLSFIRQIDIANKDLRIDNALVSNKNLADHNMHPNQHGLNVAPLKGVNTSASKKGKIDIGELLKEESMMTALEEQEKEKVAKRAIKKAEKLLAQETANEQDEYYSARMNLLEEQLK